jgi:hypothetical protein
MTALTLLTILGAPIAIIAFVIWMTPDILPPEQEEIDSDTGTPHAWF